MVTTDSCEESAPLSSGHLNRPHKLVGHPPFLLPCRPALPICQQSYVCLEFLNFGPERDPLVQGHILLPSCYKHPRLSEPTSQTATMLDGMLDLTSPSTYSQIDDVICYFPLLGEFPKRHQQVNVAFDQTLGNREKNLWHHSL